jgi:hypothetical protein
MDIRISYMDIRIYFHLLYNNMQTNPSSTDALTHYIPPPFQKKKSHPTISIPNKEAVATDYKY